jgi:hypothetical protein
LTCQGIKFPQKEKQSGQGLFDEDRGEVILVGFPECELVVPGKPIWLFVWF